MRKNHNKIVCIKLVHLPYLMFSLCIIHAKDRKFQPRYGPFFPACNKPATRYCQINHSSLYLAEGRDDAVGTGTRLQAGGPGFGFLKI